MATSDAFDAEWDPELEAAEFRGWELGFRV